MKEELHLIHVCDAIMGSGKTQAAITFMNEHPSNRYIYIAPYLEEADRIKDGCPHLNFITPEPEKFRKDGTKLEHARKLIRAGANIASTHQLFKCYDSDMLKLIRSMEYTLIIDENIESTWRGTKQYSIQDLQFLIDDGILETHGSQLVRTGKEYNGDMFRDVFRMIDSNILINLSDDNSGGGRKAHGKYTYWMLPPVLINSFAEVYVLTYLFDGQGLSSMFKLNSMVYEYISVQHKDSVYRFCEFGAGDTPSYVHRIKDMIHIIDNQRMNEVGSDRYSLSSHWYKKNKKGVDTVRKNIDNLFREIYGDSERERKMWTTYMNGKQTVGANRYKRLFLQFNARSVNTYRNKDILAYCVNIFMDVPEKRYFVDSGLDVNEDQYALSIMLQWIWRSAIRDGKPITLYLPSSRMRKILNDWMDDVSKGGDGCGKKM